MTEGIARVLYTADGDEVKVYEVVGQRVLATESLTTAILLQDIKTELRKLNMHLSLITEFQIRDADTEEEGEVL